MIASTLLTVMPWVVFGVGAGVLIWRITHVFREGDLIDSKGTEEFRQSLERIWSQSSTSL
jgi:hypothetical protein